MKSVKVVTFTLILGSALMLTGCGDGGGSSASKVKAKITFKKAD